MRKKTVLALGLAALMLSAGCLNFTNSSGDYPSEITSDDLDTHRMILENTSSYKTSVSVSIGSGGTQAGNINQSFQIDNSDEQYYMETTTNILGNVTTEKYTNASATWKRSTSAFGDGYTYDYAEAPYDAASNDTFFQPLQPVNVTQAERGFATLGDSSIKKTGTTTYNGEQVGVYEADTEQVRKILNETSSESLGSTSGSIDDGSLTVYMNSDGVLVYQQLEVSGTSEQGTSFSVTATYEVTDINSTDVTRPSWLDTARQEATNETTTNETA